MENYIDRREHEEFCKRMEDEHKRINHRVTEVENTVRQIEELTISVREMAVSMKSMLEEQQEQGDRLEVLENRDGEMWRKVVGHAITVVVGILLGFIFSQIGIQ